MLATTPITASASAMILLHEAKAEEKIETGVELFDQFSISLIKI